ncbi:hypothetical protein GALMADRAFT_1244149 [Galerina marginata CBS 339.88]|uniref:Tyrosinase C-terminal domain-containing protein n=1 Tax=Galerina marginata (strain CBS 339.88) TaxID=685588 RepID=A0A067TB20_GALM3|nr:hypothetical protein GALMADRAFT_1244149 [Galerina marginata CBS 339.88]
MNSSIGADYNTTIVQNSSFWEWTARVHIAPRNVGTNLVIFFFLGEVPEDPEQWPEGPNFVGRHSVFARSGSRVIEGFVHLNDGIMRLSGLASFDPKVVVQYLKDKLQWKVQRADGNLETNLEYLEIVILATVLTLPPGEMFPVPGEHREYNSITYGKSGGSRNSQDSVRALGVSH